jgi:hypothetical protein
MASASRKQSSDRVDLLEWTAKMGAVTAEALAQRREITLASARALLGAAERDGQVRRTRPLTDAPALYMASPAGLRACGLVALGRCRPSAANARHLSVCAWAAASLGRRYPEHLVCGERELRRDESVHKTALASATLGRDASGRRLLHRPDLVLWPPARHAALPVAVEVKLSVKAPERLAAIALAWARARCVSGVLYLATPQAERPLERAISKAHARERIVVLPLGTLIRAGD